MAKKFKKGNVVRANDDCVLVTGKSKYKSMFCGLVIMNETNKPGNYPFGHYSDAWSKDKFQKIKFPFQDGK